MKDFKLEVKFIDDDDWYIVTNTDFRWWKNPPSDGINHLGVLGKNGLEDKTGYTDYITDVRLTVY